MKPERLASNRVPSAALLGSPALRTLVMGDGSGGTWYGDLALTRWRPDAVERRHGWFFDVRDVDAGQQWRLGTDPLEDVAGATSTSQPGRFTISRSTHGIDACLEICVAPDAPVDVRRVTLRNKSGNVRHVMLTGSLEVVLADPEVDASHPAFSNLFVQTEYVEGAEVLIARRRPRDQDETHPVMFARMSGPGEFTWETDRGAFLGRAPMGPVPAACEGGPLGETAGNVLDPAFVLRRAVVLEPGRSASFDCILGAAGDRSTAVALADEFSTTGRTDRAFGEAGDRERHRLRRLQLTEEQGAQLQALGCAALQADVRLRAPGSMIERARGSQHQEPYNLVVAADGSSSSVDSAITAQRYFVALGLPLSLLVVTEGRDATVRNDRRNRVFGLRRESLTEGMLDRTMATARWLIDGPMDQWPRPLDPPSRERDPRPTTEAERAHPARSTTPADVESLRHDNGNGGFAKDGREYVIRMDGNRVAFTRPPLPWVNVIANPHFGFVVSESGAAATWSGNSRQHRLTPWLNDPIGDPHGEAMFLCDLESGAFWSPQPGPAPGGGLYETRHGLGYSLFTHEGQGLETEVVVFADRDEPVRFARLRVTNRGPRARSIAAVSYQQLVLGDRPEETGRFIVTSLDAETGALFATRSVDSAEVRVAFAHVVTDSDDVSWTGDREGFLGAPGSIIRPAALEGAEPLDGHTGPGLDPCFAQRVALDVAPGTTTECTFLLGEGEDASEAARLITTYCTRSAVETARARAAQFWDELVSGLQIETPEPSLDLMVNGWLPYQTLSCRLHGRTALYQSGGAFGYRDQLQDSTALLFLDPSYTSRQILLHAAHQFVEGDVLHWWHPPAHGIRTRFADDLLWLPLVTAEYVRWTGDDALLDAREPFLKGAALEAGEAERYITAEPSGTDGTVYEHCCRAIDRSLATGAHGLPLFGAGDWNDGMNRVGKGGTGESVWMGFFLSTVLRDFIPLCDARGDDARADRYRRHREKLKDALESAGWDGDWYRRAYYDDGTPLGTATDSECRIDGLSQAWAVLSGVASAERAERCMDAVEDLLVSERDGLIRLLTPAFADTTHDPGYIKGYVRGVRENGGQYTHAALWMVRALAQLGRRDRAARLLSMLSPVSHTSTPGRVATYRTEPYSIAADVYGEPPHVGRGGWSWYTGSSGWMYRVAVESILGLTVVGNRTLRVRPCLPENWPVCRVHWRVPGERTTYDIELRSSPGQEGRVTRVLLDGKAVDIEDGAALVPIVRDDRHHQVIVGVGSAGLDARQLDTSETPVQSPVPGR